MAINTYTQNGRKLYEVYLNGFDTLGRRIQRRKRGIETLTKAERAEFELKRELAFIKEQKVPYRWKEWFKICLDRMKLVHRPSTLIDYEKQLGKWISPKWGELELSNISRTQVHTAIYEGLDARLSAHTRKKILKMVRRIFSMAVEEGILDRNPCAGIQVKAPETEQKVLTNTEVEILLREAKLTEHRFYPMWLMALKTGMRSGELMALQWNDIDFESRTIQVSKQWSNKSGFGPTKTQKIRVVPISEDLLMFLKELKLREGSKGEFVLPHIKEWENGMQADVLRQFCAAIGITEVKFHDLRATFITNLLSRGVPLARVMAIVGHSQLKTTNGYLRKAGVDVLGATEHLGYKVPTGDPGAKVIQLKRT
jgi:integrase